MITHENDKKLRVEWVVISTYFQEKYCNQHFLQHSVFCLFVFFSFMFSQCQDFAFLRKFKKSFYKR